MIITPVPKTSPAASATPGTVCTVPRSAAGTGGRATSTVDSSLAVRTLQVLAKRGEVPADYAAKAAEKYRLHDVTAGTSGNAGGES